MEGKKVYNVENCTTARGRSITAVERRKAVPPCVWSSLRLRSFCVVLHISVIHHSECLQFYSTLKNPNNKQTRLYLTHAHAHTSLCVFVYIRRLLDIPQGDSCNVRGLMWLVSVLIITISPTVPLGPCSPAPLLHHSARVNTLRSHFASRLSPLPLMSYLLRFILRHID